MCRLKRNSSKFFFSETAGQIFKMISKDCSLGEPFQKLFVKFLSVEKHGCWCGGGGGGGGGAFCTLWTSKFFSSETADQNLQ